MGSIAEEEIVNRACNIVVHEMGMSAGSAGEAHFCLDFFDILGDEAAEEESSVGPIAADDGEHRVHEILELELSSCNPEFPELSVMDGFNLFKGNCTAATAMQSGMQSALEIPEKQNHVASLLRLNYEDVLSSWCDDRSLWTDGKRPQTVPQDFAYADHASSVMPLNDFAIVPELGSGNITSSSTGGGEEDGGRGARVTRYREKKRSRLFSKKIRYEVRKVNAERRPRMKGRFVKRISKLTGQK